VSPSGDFGKVALLSLGIFSVLKVRSASEGVVVEEIRSSSVVATDNAVVRVISVPSAVASESVTMPLGSFVVIVSVVSSVGSGVVVAVVDVLEVVVGGKVSPGARPTS
jgi:hypothetical protein